VRVASHGPRGSVNPLSVLAISAIAVAIYCLVIFAPVYLEHLDVVDVVASAFNQVGQRRDETIQEELKGRLLGIGTHRALNDDNELVEVRGLGVADEDLIYEINAAEKTAHIELRYVREVRLKPTSRWTKIRFTAKKAGVPAGLK
jgi:hypothetical protein